ncbi:hypothetical protein ACJRO7_006998 [Eucalyptus globulus]|uniref:Uncharacterized protein n=1 Tax=Eucalyptus globulus TaxID=34317 RepID=A0ABD3ING8_EUCGL
MDCLHMYSRTCPFLLQKLLCHRYLLSLRFRHGKLTLFLIPREAQESGILTGNNARDVADEAGIAVLRTPHSPASCADFVANLNDPKKLLICRSHSAPSPFSSDKESVPDLLNPGHSPGLTSSIV